MSIVVVRVAIADNFLYMASACDDDNDDSGSTTVVRTLTVITTYIQPT